MSGKAMTGMLLLTAMLWGVAGFASQDPSRPLLIHELGCYTCHTDLPQPQQFDIRDRAPDLSYAGWLYQPGYLFDYLQNPVRIRRHIGRSRMPDFHFSEPEALALVLFLQQQRYRDPRWPALPAALEGAQQAAAGTYGGDPRLLIKESGCLQCHTLENEGKGTSFDLSIVGYRIRLDQLPRYLAAPVIFGIPETVMPGPFFVLKPDSSAFVSSDPLAVAKIFRLRDFLADLGRKRREELTRRFEAAVRRYPQITAELGQKIFLSQNCQACHTLKGLRRPAFKMAPGLSGEGSRVQEAWLRSYLKKPHPVRPFGFIPGTGSRMPDFQLQPGEIEELVRYLMAQKTPQPAIDFAWTRLSAFAMAKAKKLLEEKLSCLGCHKLGNRGGRVGPDLSSLSRRLQPEYVYRIVMDPQRTEPRTVMPRVPMFPVHRKTSALIIRYLVQQKEPPTPQAYLSLVENPITFPGGADRGERLYRRYCAYCHGVEGRAEGYNAKYLPGAPTAFSNEAYLSQRPDDTLFDGIFSGGYILNRSAMMPPWGKTLSIADIQALVTHLRRLCRCQGPAWSRDNRE